MTTAVVTELGQRVDMETAEARELEQELGRLVDEARDFLTTTWCPRSSRRPRTCVSQELHRSLTEDHTEPLQQVFGEWSGEITNWSRTCSSRAT